MLPCMTSALPARGERECDWCGGALDDGARIDAIYCGQTCRSIAFRLRRRGATGRRIVGAKRFAYADPPYPRQAYRYRGEASYAGEVDHAALVARLEAGDYCGWALSTSRHALGEVLALCPKGAQALPWTKPRNFCRAKTRGLVALTEYLIVVRGRQIAPGVPDFLCAMPARGGGQLVGRKPIAFCAWLFAALGMRPGDALDDLYPGTGIVTRAWNHLNRYSGPGTALPEKAAAALPRARSVA